MRELTPQEIDALARRIKSAVDFHKLDRFLRLSTGDGLDDYVGAAVGLKHAVYAVLNQLNDDRATEQLLKLIYRESVFNDDLRNAIRAVLPDIDAAPAAPAHRFSQQQAGAPVGVSEGAGLQKLVKPQLQAVDAGVWFARLGAILRQVCAVTGDGFPLGTGFLVGPQAVLTNWHVVHESRKRGIAELACAFDYIRGADGALAPVETIGVEAVAVERPCSPAEMTTAPDDPPPRPDELDYALLKLARAPGNRGYVRLVAGPPAAARAALYIVQHCGGKPMMIAQDMEAVIGLVHGGLRLRYKTNTEPGASGSPCFTSDWDLLALHHFGDPAHAPPEYNQGIPSGLLRASIEAAHAGGLLGA
jgi:hypothetical protein